MSEKENHSHQIRDKAEAKLANMIPSQEMAGRKTDELIHELQVHQIELEMQNEELKNAQVDLEKTKERYLDLYDFAPVGYFTFSREGLIIEVNLKCAQLLWITRTELINHRFGQFVVPSDLNLWNDHLLLSMLLKDGEKQSCELRLKCEDGSTIFVRLESVRIEKMDGTLQVRTAVSDITQSKREQEERIQLMASELEARAEAQAARKLDLMKSMFIASTSHELRTPLNSIIGFTGIILNGTSGELNPDQKKQLEIVYSSGKHLLSLINDIIESSKIDAGKIDLKVSEFKIRTIVDEAILTLSVNIKAKGLKISQDVENITMRTDRLRLLQCVINLISNAVKYTENGSIKLIVKNKGNNAYISVIDTGIGIKTEDIPKLFAPFMRLRTPLTAKVSGTGLGLYLVKKITRDFLDGDVEVESEFGKGSTFTIHVPVQLRGRYENSCSGR